MTRPRRLSFTLSILLAAGVFVAIGAWIAVLSAPGVVAEIASPGGQPSPAGSDPHDAALSTPSIVAVLAVVGVVLVTAAIVVGASLRRRRRV